MQQAVYGVSRHLGDIEFLSAHFEGHRFTPHSHPVFAVGAVRSGACRIWHRGAAHVARLGDLVLMDPDAPHSAASAAGGRWRYCAVYVSVTAARTWARLPRAPGFGVVVGHDPESAAALERLCALLEEDPEAPGTEPAFAWLVRRLFDRFGGNGRSSSEAAPCDDDVLWEARRYLDAHYAETVRIEQLADLAGRNPFALTRAFSRAFGMPPYTYLTHVRITRAQELLRAGRPISDTAFSVGFSDQSHLTRFFRRVVGVPPGVWVRGVGVGHHPAHQ